ncbi:MAG TPA: ABC transporter substrate-binding protein [Casimicrobiaceae bacterium]|nr:ABC transporter substrate-binding protein [Casimicrobiaceae bacterium]
MLRAVKRSLAATAVLLALAPFLPSTPLAADPRKVLRVAFEAGETGFDPVKVTDSYSSEVMQVVFERLLTYDYLARPMKLVPGTAETLPEITDNGKTFLFKLRKGITFQADPAFKGPRRELTVADYAYSIKRLVDPANRSPWRFLVNGKIAGLDEVAKKAERTKRFDYDTVVPGLEIVDRYTLRVRLTATDYNFVYIMAMPAMSAVAREVIEAYPDDTNAHPVGTGPYVLKSWTRKARIVLEANPDYREVIWDFVGSNDPRDQAAVAAMKGKRIPQIGQVEISIIEEEQSRWLAFQHGEIDYIDRFVPFAPIAIPDNKLAPDLAARGITLDRSVEPEVIYYFFNMKDPVVGGYSKEKIALRRALIMSYDTAEEIRVIRKNQAIENQMPVPAGVVGHDPGYRGILAHDPKLANELLDYFGYKKGADGYRNDPSGKPFTIVLTSETQAIYREYDELWKKALDGIGVRFETRKGPFSDNLKAAEACQLAMWGSSWHADYPDGENFMQLLYGPNTHESNHGCYQSAAFDEMYVRLRNMPDSAERNRLFLLMSRQMEVDGAWKVGVSRYRNVLVYPQVKGYRFHPINTAVWEYLDIDPAARRQ